MFENSINYFKIELTLAPVTPFLIKSGSEKIDPSIPDMSFVRVNTPYGETVYIPGSSFKGAIRAHTEKNLIRLGKKVCSLEKNPCGIPNWQKNEGVNNKSKGDEIYKHLCYACRMFGSLISASPTKFWDMYPYPEGSKDEEKSNKIKEIRKYISIKSGVRIDPFSGSAKRGGLYDLEVVSGGKFHGGIVIQNAEKWQLALLLQSLYDINAGYQQIGFAKTRGLGKVNINIEHIEVLSSDDNTITFAKYNETANKFDMEKERFEFAKKTKEHIMGSVFSIDKENVRQFFESLLKNKNKWW